MEVRFDPIPRDAAGQVSFCGIATMARERLQVAPLAVATAPEFEGLYDLEQTESFSPFPRRRKHRTMTLPKDMAKGACPSNCNWAQRPITYK